MTRPLQSMLGLVLLLVVSPVSAGEFPDDWFFSGANRPASLKALEGKPAPELDLDEWIGDEVSLEDWRGEVIIVDFWATWCGPCMAAIPKNVELVNEHEDEGLRFIGVHDSRRGWETASSVVNDKGINYPVARDDGGKSVKSYGLAFWPTYVAIDRKGIVRAAGLKPGNVADVIAALLKEPRPAGTGRGAAGGEAASSTVGVAEFPADWYLGGERRPSSLLRIERAKAPAIKTTAWLAGAPKDAKVPVERGRVTVVHFLATWSTPSRMILPRMLAESNELRRQGADVLLVVDHGADESAALAFLARGGIDADSGLRIAIDAKPLPDAKEPIGATASAYGLRAWPTTVIIDRAGRVRAPGVHPRRVRDVVGTLMAERLETPGTDAD